MDLPDRADVHILVAELQIVAAGVGIGGLHRRQHLRQRDAIAQQLIRIGLDLILPRRPAKRRDVDDARNLFELAAHEPVLRGLDLAERIAGTHELVAEDLADRRPRRELRLKIVRQRKRLEAIEHLLTVAEVFAVEVEVELHVREPEDADRPHLIEMRRAVQRRLDGHGDLLLHLFRGPRRVLRDDLDQRWRGVRVGLDVEPRDEEAAEGKHDEEDDEDDGAIADEETDQWLHVSSPLVGRSSAPPMLTTLSPSVSPVRTSMFFTGPAAPESMDRPTVTTRWLNLPEASCRKTKVFSPSWSMAVAGRMNAVRIAPGTRIVANISDFSVCFGFARTTRTFKVWVLGSIASPTLAMRPVSFRSG